MLIASMKIKKALGKQVYAHVRTPLYRNGYALTLGSMLTSSLGVIYWIIAARYYPADIVGLSSAIIAAMALLAGVGVLSLSGVLVRFTPLAGHATQRLVIYSYGVSITAAFIVSLIFSRYVGLWSPKLKFLGEDKWWGAMFVFATMTWCIFSLQDSALTGLRQALWIPIENTIFAIAKIVFLVIFAKLIPTWGIFAAWTIPVVGSLFPINLLLFRSLIPRHIRTTKRQECLAMPQEITKYILGNYPGTLFYLASTTFLPLLVTQQAGARANAYFYIPWMIASGLQSIPLNMTTSLTVEAVRDEVKVGIYSYRVLLQILRLLTPLVSVILLIAPLILAVFGYDYAQNGALLLRLLALATIPNTFVMIYISVVRVQNRMGGVIWVQGAQCLLLLGISYILLPISGITGVGWASLASQTCIAVLLLFTQLRSILWSGRVAHRHELSALRRLI